MKLFLIGLGCFVLGAIFGMWLLVQMVMKLTDWLEREDCL